MGGRSNHGFLFPVIPLLGICELYIVTSTLLDTFMSSSFLLTLGVETITGVGAATVGVAGGATGGATGGSTSVLGCAASLI